MTDTPGFSALPDAPEVAALRAEVRRTMQDFPPDYWQQVDRERAFPEAFFDAIGRAGYFGTLLPSAYGGADAGPVAASVLIEEISRAGGDAAAINAQLSICTTLARDGNEALKQRYLPEIARGTIRCLAVAATEPDSGADMRTLKSRARREGDAWVLDAQKVFISFAEHTRLLFVLAQTDEGPTVFLLDRATLCGGLELRPIEMIVNRLTTSLFLDGVRVSDEARIGPVGGGLACLMKGFSARRIFAASECLGNARFLLDRALDNARERQTFGRTIGANQGVQYPLAQAHVRVEAADLMRWEALRTLTSGADAGARSAMAKLLASEACWEMGRAAMTAFGGWALASELHIERKLRDSTIFLFNNMLWSYVAEQSLGLPKAF